MSGSTSMAILAIVSGCGGAPADSAGPGGGAAAACATDTGGPTPGWSDWGAGFFGTWCQPCHASEAPQRYGAPAAISFDSEADAAAQAPAIRRAVLDQETMPIGGGLSPADRDRLAAWLCAAEAP